MCGLRSYYDHQIYLERVNKSELNPFDNKHRILLDGIRSLLYNYWKIKAYQYYVDSRMSPEITEEKAMSITL